MTRLPVFQRTGECNRCGECCRGDPFNGEKGPPAIPGMCPLYRDEDGVGVCSDRNGHYYLRACALWPSAPEQLAEHPSCSYRFERVG